MKATPVFSTVRAAALVLALLADSSGFSQTTPACAPSPPGLVSWWRAENNVLDQVDARHGSLRNGATFAAGKSGTAFAFDGQDDEASLPETGFAAITNDFTVELWVNPAAGRGSIPETIGSQTGISTGQRYAVFPAHGDNVYGAGHAGMGLFRRHERRRRDRARRVLYPVAAGL